MTSSSSTANTTIPSHHHGHHLLVTWNILHELCISGSSTAASLHGGGPTATAVTTITTKNDDDENNDDDNVWLQRKEIRESIGESVILPGMEFLYKSSLLPLSKSNGNETAMFLWQVREKIKSMLGIWQDLDSFESPTLLAEMKRLVLKMFQQQQQQQEGEAGVDGEEEEEEENVTRGQADVSLDVNHQESNEIGSGTIGAKNAVATVGDDDDADAEMDSISNNEAEQECIQSENEEMTNVSNVQHGKKYLDEKDCKTEVAKSTTDPGQELAAQDGEEEQEEEEEEEQGGGTKKDAGMETLFDFEKEGIPEERVSVHDLLRACKAVATLQITRDMRNDSSHNLTSILSNVPQNVWDACRLVHQQQEKKESQGGGEEKVDVEKNLHVNDIPDEVLDLDIARALANVKLHRDIIQRQREFKKECIELLIKSRCNFGSVEAASLFYELDHVRDKLNKRKALVLDAMELEGIEAEAMEGWSNNNVREGEDDEEEEEHEDRKEEDDSVAQSSFAWFSREDANAKKQKLTVE